MHGSIHEQPDGQTQEENAEALGKLFGFENHQHPIGGHKVAGNQAHFTIPSTSGRLGDQNS